MPRVILSFSGKQTVTISAKEKMCVFKLLYTRRKGMMLSLAMACRSRGAPVSDWRPAPHVEKNEPITMTQGVGQARVPTTRFPSTESPNLHEERAHTVLSLYICNSTFFLLLLSSVHFGSYFRFSRKRLLVLVTF